MGQNATDPHPGRYKTFYRAARLAPRRRHGHATVAYYRGKAYAGPIISEEKYSPGHQRLSRTRRWLDSVRTGCRSGTGVGGGMFRPVAGFHPHAHACPPFTGAMTGRSDASVSARPAGTVAGPDRDEADLLVLGGGAAGIGAARAARRRGASVILVERERVGGDCTFTGCVPSKTLLESAAGGASFAEAMSAVSRAVATVAAGEDASVLQREGIRVLNGSARLTGRRRVLVGGRQLRAVKGIVIATGASPTVPPIRGIEAVSTLTSDTVFSLTERPGSLAVLGGGPIGVELADAFARFGSSVTVLEAAGRILPREEPLASSVLSDVLARRGITIMTGSPVVRVAPAAVGGVQIALADGRTVAAEALLVAVGRTPCTEGLGLETVGVELTDRGFIGVDSRLRTSARHVFAAGDVAMQPQFTHVAHRTGSLAAINALSPLPVLRFRTQSVPWVTFTSPEVARVGLTEAAAAEHGGRVAFLPLTEVDRAITAGVTDGFVKLIVGPRRVFGDLAGGRVLGATIVAARAGEMLQEIILAMRLGMFPACLALTLHPYPTWSTAVQQAAAQLFGGYGGRRATPAAAVLEPEPGWLR